MAAAGQSNQDAGAALQAAIDFTQRQLRSKRLAPVKRKIYKLIHERLLIVQTDLPEDPSARSRIIEITRLLDTENENAIWDIADALKELLIEIGPAEYVYRSLVEEKGRKHSGNHQWIEYFGRRELDQAIRAFEDKSQKLDRDLAAQRLLSLYRLRDNDGRHDRARQDLRWRYLTWVSASLLIVTLVSVLVMSYSDPSSLGLSEILIVGSAGAVGALISGTLALSNLGSIVELKGASKTLFPQVFLGASLAYVVVITLKTNLVSVAGIEFDAIEPAGLYVLGLLSGFSEPFTLSILDKISRLWK